MAFIIIRLLLSDSHYAAFTEYMICIFANLDQMVLITNDEK